MTVALFIVFGYSALIATAGWPGVVAAATHLALLALASSITLARRR